MNEIALLDCKIEHSQLVISARPLNKFPLLLNIKGPWARSLNKIVPVLGRCKKGHSKPWALSVHKKSFFFGLRNGDPIGYHSLQSSAPRALTRIRSCSKQRGCAGGGAAVGCRGCGAGGGGHARRVGVRDGGVREVHKHGAGIAHIG